MTTVKNKFVLIGHQIILARVNFHSDLDKNPHVPPSGGGWWYYHKETNKVFLFGHSFDYGGITQEQFEKAIIHDEYFRFPKGADVIFDMRSHLEVLEILAEHLGKEEAERIVNECEFIRI